MLELTIESYLCEQARAHDGFALKLTFIAGIPDRLIVLPGPWFRFVEVKTTRGTLSKIQKIWHKKLELVGCPVSVPRTHEDVDEIFYEYARDTPQ